MKLGAILAIVLLAMASLPASAQNTQEKKAARQILTMLQPLSFENNREYCGLLLRRGDGTLFSSKAFGGREARCRVRDIPDEGRIVASYHTHGAYLPVYDNEVPSVLDLEIEMEWGIDGYVATPGGRFWHVDGRAGQINLICGRSCLPSDPNYQDQSDTFGKIRTRYSLKDLITRSLGGG